MNKRIYKNVRLGKGSKVEEFVVIGQPPRGKKDGELPTVIGRNAVIRSGTVIYAGNKVGDNFQTGHNVMIRESNKIDDDVSVGSLSCVEHHVKIGKNVRIHSLAFISEYSILEDNCWIGPSVVLTNAIHPLCPKVKECLRGPTIKVNAKIGANSTILPAVTIGKNSFIGAGSVVTKDVLPSSVVAGNPARVINEVKDLKCKSGFSKRPYAADRDQE